ncbi:uncharacterized protein LOC126747852 [Anthonomus grandis grandis]|uniref:uncharacterized protein LOC126747852 n=1 Tax=Anthonomus grandis grandis TaxID=2921223 RepID=UPI0021657FFF|nr:uncharacterized protein LOC126747852 [Anthonomus grandis grandis]
MLALKIKTNTLFQGTSVRCSSTSSSSSSPNSSDSSSTSSSSESDEEHDPFGSDDSIKDPLYENTNSPNNSDTSEEENIHQPKKRKLINKTEIKQMGKRKKKNVLLWKKNQTKILRNTRKAYVSTQIKKNEDGTKIKMQREHPQKSIQSPCNEKCRLKCYIKILEEQRLHIFNEYYSLGDINKQREYISSNMTSINSKYKYSNTEQPRNPNNAFHFIISSTKVRVCKKFFMATLAINNRTIQTVLKKQKSCESGTVIETDKRGRHQNHKKISDEIKTQIRNHINSIPRIDSHYCRSRTTKEYIEGGKSLMDIHRDYVSLSKEKNQDFGNYQLYSKIFNEEYNIAFHLPKKDQCELCIKYQNATDEEMKKLEEKYNQHIQEKELSRLEKETDKQNMDGNIKVLVYDLQKVLPCPMGQANSFYYVSKLNVFNLTIFDIKETEGTCYVWHEGQCLRGADDIGT